MKKEEAEEKSPLEEAEGFFDILTIRDESQIEREIGRGLLFLRFSPIMERAFLDYYYHKFIWQIRIAILIGILLYALFGVLDAVIFPEEKDVMWFIRYGVVCPAGLVVLFLTFRVRRENLIQVAHALLVILAGAGIVLMIYVAPAGQASIYYAGLMLVVFYAYTFSAMRFYYATLSAIGVTFIYVIVHGFLLNGWGDQMLANLFFLGSSNLIGLPVSYLLERHSRKDFLLTMLIALEKRKADQLNLRLKDISFVDGLTGTANRHRFEEFLTKEWERARRNRKPISILLIDIDFFKEYNDLLGHLEGDECLRKVAQTITRHVRRGVDLVARYGGEEFVVVLPETNLDQAKGVAERIRRDVKNLRIPHPASRVSEFVTVSVGVATLIPTDNLSKEVIVNMADKALYRAKRSGRNRVKVFTPYEEWS